MHYHKNVDFHYESEKLVVLPSGFTFNQIDRLS